MQTFRVEYFTRGHWVPDPLARCVTLETARVYIDIKRSGGYTEEHRIVANT
jgi:hypothetical protein